MARLEDIPEPTRTAVESLACPAFDTTPFVSGPSLAQRRVALVSSAALIRRGDTPFAVGASEFRELSADWSAADILISHVSINFDRAGFQRDLNVVYPLERLHELAQEGVIASVADTHYTVMGSTDPATMVDTAQRMAAAMHADRVNAVVLAPV
ncbi:MAG: glycine/sarcosine/betaine reductase selenoprotein B family protein [Burkholderiales bacterium]